MSLVYRIYVQKKKEYAVEARAVYSDLVNNLQIKHLKDLTLVNRYDVQGISENVLNRCKNTVFSELSVDDIVDFDMTRFDVCFAVEYLPGQYDQRADSCQQCIKLLDSSTEPIVRSARIYCLSGQLTDDDINKIKKYLINPVESREATMNSFETLEQDFPVPKDIEIIEEFTNLGRDGLSLFISKYGLAMDIDDILMLRNYFRDEEKRQPTMTEIRMIDTYWSDHCRHTTFSTVIEQADIEPDYIKDTYDLYLETRKEVYSDKTKDICLMDMATVAVKYLKKNGKLKSLDESEEINACSVKIKVKVNGQDEDWLLMFKNETHNHPTEIEPFGGAATCIGGAIRDPLSGRVYVYQAMRITGCGNPLTGVEDTLAGKLPQKKLTKTAAKGYSSYGNQIGLATGYVREIYHDGYVAKRMEVGAVVGAAKEENVIRKRPKAGDVVLLIGGRTGRDGCGGATGSSKSHTAESLNTCGAEVQKGNAPEERKIQRLFRKSKVTKLIKRCNDFGAGGVSVAIGELADGLNINLDAVPKKYEGLDGTELAISESQERMAVVVESYDAENLIKYAGEENLLATPVAVVTDENRLVMNWRGQKIVDISREFLNSNGAKKTTKVKVVSRDVPALESSIPVTRDNVKKWVQDLNHCCQKGLVDMFDSSIGAGTVTMPFGGKHQLSPSQTMTAKIPVLSGDTTTCSIMSYGFDPYMSEKSPYHGAMYAVVSSIAKLVAGGGSMSRMWLSFQEYFPKTSNSEKWGLPFEALLGAYLPQMKLGIGAIGGKDSMSGTFENYNVPPTLVSFAVSTGDTSRVVTTEFKKNGSNLFLFKPKFDKNGIVDFEHLKEMYTYIEGMVLGRKILSSYEVSNGLCEAVVSMSVGNGMGCRLDTEDVFSKYYGGILIETDEDEVKFADKVGVTTDDGKITINDVSISLDEVTMWWMDTLEPVFPLKSDKGESCEPKEYACTKRSAVKAKTSFAKPIVTIPVFPGTNCEYDTAKAFEKAGAIAQTVVIRNLNSAMIEESVTRLKNAIDNSNIIMLPGGFSGGDEPDGSGKFISVFFRNPYIKDSVMELLKNRDGLMLGICNGFQALIKLGLVPYGEIRDCDETCPTLTFNEIGRHQSVMVNTRISSVNSPWLSGVNVGDIHTVPVSHGEGRFVAPRELIAALGQKGQIATQYVDKDGKVTMDIRYNPNGSMEAVEGILSEDGRVFGKMGHSERFSEGTYKNIYGDFDQKIFESGVNYFK